MRAVLKIKGNPGVPRLAAMLPRLAVLAILALVAPVQAGPVVGKDLPRDEGIVVDHQPHPYGGFGSDTEFRDDWGDPVWQREADDILLDEAAAIRQIVWWGFYGGTFDDWPEPPPQTEAMRIRFYQARLGDGLPDEDNMSFEQTYENPIRTATGRVIMMGRLPLEYRYEVDLASPIVLEANTPYWLEIAQMGDLESHFRWEYGLAELNGTALINEVVGWGYTYPDVAVDAAFQLWTVPEPQAALLLSLSLTSLLLFSRSTKKTTRRA
jgi:hypothetical protein